MRKDLIELIETVIIYKLPRLTREEIQTMLQVHDIRETRVFQEGKEEGNEEGKEEGKEEVIAYALAKMSAKKMSPEEIADILGLDAEQVRQVMSNSDRSN